MSDLRLIRGASPSRLGGIHWYEWKPKDEVIVGPPAPGFLLLHPVPGDGACFTKAAPFLAAGRTVIAADYPGYGKSDPLPGPASVGDWADTMLDTLAARSMHGAADLLGFRAGCFVAAEMSLRGADAVRRLVLVDLPCFGPAGGGETPGPELRYPADERLSRITHESLVISTGCGPREASVDAARALPRGRLVELPEVVKDPMTSGAARLSEAVLSFLAGEAGQAG